MNVIVGNFSFFFLLLFLFIAQPAELKSLSTNMFYDRVFSDMTLLYILFSTLAVSIISLIGIVTLSMKKKFLDNILMVLVGFSAGGLFGGAFLHLLPEALKSRSENTFLYVIAGFSFFFVIERYMHWRHCHKDVCSVHTFAYLNLVGDGLHNFTDGLIIAVSFTVSINFGLITTMVIIFHEIPQEIGDYAVLVYGGFSRIKALFFNFLCALTAIAGGITGFFLSGIISGIQTVLLPVTAGGFIYIAASDLIPELHKQKNSRMANLSLTAFFAGILLILFAKKAHPL